LNLSINTDINITLKDCDLSVLLTSELETFWDTAHIRFYEFTIKVTSRIILYKCTHGAAYFGII